MKKLILLATVILALTYQPSKAQISFNLNISSGPAYGYYEPVHYADPVVYQPRIVVYHSRPVVYHRSVVHRRPVVYHSKKRAYVAPRQVYYTKHYNRGKSYRAPVKVYKKSSHYRAAPRKGKAVQYNAVRGRYQTVHYRR